MIQGKCTAIGILLVITLVQGKQHLILIGQVELLYDWFSGFPRDQEGGIMANMASRYRGGNLHKKVY